MFAVIEVVDGAPLGCALTISRGGALDRAAALVVENENGSADEKAKKSLAARYVLEETGMHAIGGWEVWVLETKNLGG